MSNFLAPTFAIEQAAGRVMTDQTEPGRIVLFSSTRAAFGGQRDLVDVEVLP